MKKLIIILTMIQFSFAQTKTYYTVQKGDQLGIILKSIGFPLELDMWGKIGAVEKVAKQNNMKNSNKIEPKQTIKIDVTREELLWCNFYLKEKEIFIKEKIVTNKDLADFLKRNPNCKKIVEKIEEKVAAPAPVKKEEPPKKEVLKNRVTLYSYTYQLGNIGKRSSSLGAMYSRQLNSGEDHYIAFDVGSSFLQYNEQDYYMPRVGFNLKLKLDNYFYLLDQLHYEKELYSGRDGVIQVDAINQRIGLGIDLKYFIIGYFKNFQLPLEAELQRAGFAKGDSAFIMVDRNKVFGMLEYQKARKLTESITDEEKVTFSVGLNF